MVETSGTLTSFGKCQCFYRCTMYIDGNWVENTPRWLSQPVYTLQHPQNTPGNSKNTPRLPKHTPMTPRNSFDYSKTLVRHSERHLGCQGMSGRTLGEMRVSDHVCCMSGMLLSVWGCYGNVLGYVRGDFGVSGDIWGCLWVLEGVRGARGGVW